MGPESGHEEVKPLTASQGELVDAEAALNDANERLDIIRESGIEGQDAGGKYSAEDWQTATEAADAARTRIEAARQNLAAAGESEPQ